MKLKYIIIFILFLNTISIAQNCKVKLIISTDNDLAAAYIGDTLIGTGRRIETEVEQGKYILTVMENSDRWNAKTFYDTLVIDSCSDKTLRYHFFSETYLNTNPQDVYVFSRDTLIGHTPLVLDGEIKEFELRKPGYETKIITLSEVLDNHPIKLNFLGEPNHRNFYERDIFKMLVGGIVVLGTATAYFKIKADQKFDKYKISGEDNLLKETRRYDLISGITFAAVQLNFGILIYYFLTD